MKKLIASLLLFLPLLSKAEESFSFGGKWKGLNNGDASILIEDNEAQDLQDVDISETGSAIKKRSGYTRFKTVGVSTIGVRGGYYFRDASGSDLTVHANNQSVFKSASGAAYSAFITTDTAGSYYDFTDSNGYLYRATSNRDGIARYDGTTTSYLSEAPLGNQVEALPDRLVVSGTAANPNRIGFSASADFTDFTTGTDESSAFTEDFGLPGQAITAMKYACGELLVWTNSSMFAWSGSNQYDATIRDITSTVGTTQPNSVIEDLGIIYWQGQDRHIYAYDCNTIQKVSQKISGSVSSFAGGEALTYSETTESDFEAGTLSQVTTDITSGDVMLSTWTDTDTSTADFAAGTFSNTFTASGRVYLSTSDTNVDNNGFETGTSTTACTTSNWTGGKVGYSSGACLTYCQDGLFSLNSTPRTGSHYIAIANCAGCTDSNTMRFELVDLSSTVLTSNTHTAGWQCGSGVGTSWTQATLNTSSYVGKWVKIRIRQVFDSGTQTYSDAFLCSGGTITYYYGNAFTSSGGVDTRYLVVDDITLGRSDIYSGTFTSAAFDTAFESSATWLTSGANWTTNSHAISLQTQSSSDASTWATAVAWSTGSAPSSAADRYIRYVATISTGGTTNGTALPYIDDVTFVARATTGTFTSQAINIGANITSWGNFSADQTLDSGTIGYSIRTATTEGGLTAASWVTLTRDSQITASTNAWAQVGSTFTITGAQNPTMSNFTLSWNEGAITRTYSSVDEQHRLMWSLSDDGSATNTSTYIYDPRFDSWLKYSVPFDAPARVGSKIRFGDPSSGTVYTWPVGTSDNGSAITAYFKSKDFILGDPFVEKDILAYNFIAKTQTGSNIDFTYSVDASTSSTTVNYSLTDTLLGNYRRINDQFPAGTFGSFINLKFGNDDADAPFEFYIAGVRHTPRAWRVMQ